jgi:hypothetical protein
VIYSLVTDLAETFFQGGDLLRLLTNPRQNFSKKTGYSSESKSLTKVRVL